MEMKTGILDEYSYYSGPLGIVGGFLAWLTCRMCLYCKHYTNGYFINCKMHKVNVWYTDHCNKFERKQKKDE